MNGEPYRRFSLAHRALQFTQSVVKYMHCFEISSGTVPDGLI